MSGKNDKSTLAIEKKEDMVKLAGASESQNK